MSWYETEERAHGRVETRRSWMTERIPSELRHMQWKGVRSMGKVEATRTVNGKPSPECRYDISSLPADAERLAEAVRGQ